MYDYDLKPGCVISSWVVKSGSEEELLHIDNLFSILWEIMSYFKSGF